jgi:hypothetical protein
MILYARFYLTKWFKMLAYRAMRNGMKCEGITNQQRRIMWRIYLKGQL